ncbi:GTPase-activating protein GCS1 [Saccharomyces paradoxus]|uniref:GTPase-activating protein GCS1 n=1 Tax=Saccharomyces paradoxus TaxID=27291 RepID=A0A8B8UMR1_SACPA|nr:Gcs1 [Saccharomyces paradoxus]QHS72022.1 Gcs1 [Saccharomyces paradoxus]
MSDWKVDPDTRRRLLQLQKIGANKKCMDCGAPNPQWATPKFGAFICLECAGIHRGLGVHISFVRSITMDQFKPEELLRMEKGGNEPLTEWFKSHDIDLSLPQKVKYDNPIAEDYKEKLTCLCEDRLFEEREHLDFDGSNLSAASPAAASATPGVTQSREGTPLENRRSATPANSGNASNPQKEKNEAYFAELGKKNQSRPDHLPPSQGGKYQGFGSTPANLSQERSAGSANTLSLENFQADPLGTLSRGWGLFSSAVTKSFEDVNETVIKPHVQQWQSGELSEETKRAAAQFGQKFQETSSYGFQAFSNFTKNFNGSAEDNSTAANTTHTGYQKIDNTDKTNEQDEDKWDDF